MALISDGETGSSARTKINDSLTLTQAITATASELNRMDGTLSEVRTTLGLDTTANQSDSTNKRFMSDAQEAVLDATSGTNTGDQTISDATISTTDITTNNATTSKHGFLKKLSNVANEFINGVGDWVNVATVAMTLTNKTLIASTNVIEEITTTVSSATPTPTGGSLRNFLHVTALAVGATIAAPSGTPVAGNMLWIAIDDNGSSQTVALNATFKFPTGLTPTATDITKTLHVGARYINSAWQVVAIQSVVK